MSYRHQSLVLLHAQRDLRDIRYTVAVLRVRLEHDRSIQYQHAVALLAAVRYKLICLETALIR